LVAVNFADKLLEEAKLTVNMDQGEKDELEAINDAVGDATEATKDDPKLILDPIDE
jgi:SspJ family small acid-soluble spore protein